MRERRPAGESVKHGMGRPTAIDSCRQSPCRCQAPNTGLIGLRSAQRRRQLDGWGPRPCRCSCRRPDRSACAQVRARIASIRACSGPLAVFGPRVYCQISDPAVTANVKAICRPRKEPVEAHGAVGRRSPAGRIEVQSPKPTIRSSTSCSCPARQRPELSFRPTDRSLHMEIRPR